ncbi:MULTISPECIES: carbohydrate ABC transporter permease [unclassified Salinibacterium]|uniref:carbohydrate ABC transporter permease n=1 Tax=unclassified Salinibacterium TaxID=2632331 RepID=UPI0018CDD0B0|nr:MULTISPECIES: sugar ABC transporter permease [unclassified Salinibacterium]MBH0055138.1 sugar ABC transporter permease [Salinibacterium sp. SWN139]MBH0084567.1 sugar ABC transporter permease [Salinibacterium sp. SWN167]
MTTAPLKPSRGLRRSATRGGGYVNLLYLPALVLFAVFMIYPLISGIGLAFTNWNGYSEARSFVGFDNFARLFSDPVFATAVRNTFIFGIGCTIIQQVFGLGLAIALDKPLRGRSTVRAIVYLPVLVSPIIMGTMYYLLLQYNDGAFNDVVVAFGGERMAWLADSSMAIAIIVAVNSLQFMGISMIIYLAGLQSIPEMYYDAASLDGATTWQQFRYVTVPLLQPAFATSIVLNLIGGLKLFDVIKILTNGGPGYSTQSVSTLISTTYFDSQSAGYASAMGVALFAIIIVITIIMNKVLGSRKVEA